VRVKPHHPCRLVVDLSEECCHKDVCGRVSSAVALTQSVAKSNDRKRNSDSIPSLAFIRRKRTSSNVGSSSVSSIFSSVSRLPFIPVERPVFALWLAGRAVEWVIYNSPRWRRVVCRRHYLAETRLPPLDSRRPSYD